MLSQEGSVNGNSWLENLEILEKKEVREIKETVISWMPPETKCTEAKNITGERKQTF